MSGEHPATASGDDREQREERAAASGAGHVPSVGGQLTVFVVLLGLTAATVAAAYFDLGPLNPVVAMTIAAAKAVLVALYFMHLRWTSRLTAVFAVAAIAWFALLLALTWADVRYRPVQAF